MLRPMNLLFRGLFLALSCATLLSIAGCSAEVCETCGSGGGASTSAVSLGATYSRPR